jgi:hypothetical protein
MKVLALAAAALVGVLAVAGPVEARDWRHDRHHNGWNNGHHNGWNNHHRRCWTEWRHHRRVRVCR